MLLNRKITIQSHAERFSAYVYWLNVDQRQELENMGDNAEELLRFEFKTKPVAGRTKPHDHNHGEP